MQPQLTPEQQELLNAMNELILSVQELSYTANLIPIEIIERYQEMKDHMDSVKTVIRAAYRLHKLIKRRAAI